MTNDKIKFVWALSKRYRCPVLFSAISLLVMILFLNYLSHVDFPQHRVLNSLSPILTPVLNLGETIHRLKVIHQPGLLIATVLVTLLLSATVFFYSKAPKRSTICLITGLGAAAFAHLSYSAGNGAISILLLGAAAALFFLGIYSLPLPCSENGNQALQRKKYGILTLILFMGFVFRAVHLDNVPPGQAEHTALWGMQGAKLALEQPWTPDGAVTNLNRAYQLLSEDDHEASNILVDWILFSFWPPSLLIQRGFTIFVGLLNIAALFFLGELLFGTTIGLVSAFLMAVSPWHVIHSRYSSIEHVTAILFVILSIYCWMQLMKKPTVWRVLSVILVFSVDFYLYIVAEVVVFILLGHGVYHIWRYPPHRKRMILIFAIIIAALSLLTAPKTGIFGFKDHLNLFNSSVGTSDHYAFQSLQKIAVNTKLAARSLLLAGDGSSWFSKEGGFLLWPVSVALLGGCMLALRRLKEERFILLLMVLLGGIAPAIGSPEAAPRRMLCALPAMFILSSVFIALSAQTIGSIKASWWPPIRLPILIAVIFLFSSSAMATLFYHTMASEVLINGKERRIAEIVLENLPDTEIYLYYNPFTIEEKIWVLSGKYQQKNSKLPIHFFKTEHEFWLDIADIEKATNNIICIMPMDEKGQTLMKRLKPIFRNGVEQAYRFDPKFIDHDNGEALCMSYRFRFE